MTKLLWLEQNNPHRSPNLAKESFTACLCFWPSHVGDAPSAGQLHRRDVRALSFLTFACFSLLPMAIHPLPASFTGAVFGASFGGRIEGAIREIIRGIVRGAIRGRV